MSRTAIQASVGAAAAVAAAALSAVANWRLALLAGVIATAIAATRVRYARLLALALVALVLGLTSAGLSAGSDDRTAAHTKVRGALRAVQHERASSSLSRCGRAARARPLAAAQRGR